MKITRFLWVCSAIIILHCGLAPCQSAGASSVPPAPIQASSPQAGDCSTSASTPSGAACKGEPARVNNLPFSLSSDADLGPQIKSMIQSANSRRRTDEDQPIHLELAPNALYFANTPIQAGIGFFVDCHGSTIDISRLAGGAFINWSNSWSNLGKHFVHTLTGIRNCRFMGPNAQNSVYVGYVGAISDFFAENIVIYRAGAFVIDGPSANDSFSNVNTYHPLNPQVWKQELSSAYSGTANAFGPGKVLMDHAYCEEAPPTIRVTCFELQSGDVILRDPHTEAVAVAVHLNGQGRDGISASIEGGTLEFRTFPGGSTGVLIDGAGTFAHTKINGVQFIFGDTQAQTDWAVVVNGGGSNGAYLDFTANTVIGASAPQATCDVLKIATHPVYLTFVGNTLQPIAGQCMFNDFELANGSIDQSTISSNNQNSNAGLKSNSNFVAPGSTGSISNSTIAAQTFSRVTNFTNLGANVNLTGNTFIAPKEGTKIVFQGAGALVGNVFDSPPSVVLGGSACLGNTRYECPRDAAR